MLSIERTQWSKLIYVPLGIHPPEFAPQPFRELRRGSISSASDGWRGEGTIFLSRQRRN